jgi:predicted nucleic acid-binding protein
MTALYFVDTNLLVYSRDASEPEKQPRAAAWREHLWRTRTGRLSVQVLNEYYQVVTRKLKPGLPRNVARDEVRDLMLWQPLPLNASVLEAAFDVEERWKLSFWDSLIVAAAHHLGCDGLLTEDLDEDSNYDGLRVINPFKVDPPR